MLTCGNQTPPVNHPRGQTPDSHHSVSSLQPLVDVKHVNQPCPSHQLKSEHGPLTGHLAGFLTRPSETGNSFRGGNDTALDVKTLGRRFLTQRDPAIDILCLKNQGLEYGLWFCSVLLSCHKKVPQARNPINNSPVFLQVLEGEFRE